MTRKLIYFLKYLKYYFSQKNPVNLPLHKCIKGFFNGFTPIEYYYFDLDNNNMKEYLSEFKRLYYRTKLNGPDYSAVLDNKLLFKLVAGNKINLSKVALKKEKGVYIDDNDNKVSLDNVLKELNGEYIIKPLSLGGGKGINKLTFKKEKYYIDDKEISLEDIKKELEKRSNFILEVYVKQAKYSSDIFPDATNTIRMITLKKEDGSIILLKAMHRFGTKTSIPTDNASRGGISCDIEKETGTLRKCKTKWNREWLTHHPDTNAEITGTKVPNWNELVNKIIGCHEKLDFLTYVAWDILVTNDNDYIILEANASSGSYISQLEEGIKKNPEFYKFYKKIGAFK